MPTGDPPGSLILADGEIVEGGLALSLGDHRPHLGPLIEGLADPKFRGPLGERLDERLVDPALHQHPGPGAAVLPAVAEHRHHRRGHAPIEVGVGEDEVGRLAAQLE